MNCHDKIFILDIYSLALSPLVLLPLLLARAAGASDGAYTIAWKWNTAKAKEILEITQYARCGFIRGSNSSNSGTDSAFRVTGGALHLTQSAETGVCAHPSPPLPLPHPATK